MAVEAEDHLLSSLNAIANQITGARLKAEAIPDRLMESYSEAVQGSFKGNLAGSEDQVLLGVNAIADWLAALRLKAENIPDKSEPSDSRDYQKTNYTGNTVSRVLPWMFLRNHILTQMQGNATLLYNANTRLRLEKRDLEAKRKEAEKDRDVWKSRLVEEQEEFNRHRGVLKNRLGETHAETERDRDNLKIQLETRLRATESDRDLWRSRFEENQRDLVRERQRWQTTMEEKE